MGERMDHRLAAQGACNAARTTPMNQPIQTLLVVDDEAPVRRLLRRYFESEGYAVLEAANTAEAMDALHRCPVDLVTLDIALDGDDGLDTARRIRSQSDVGIIMVSGKGELVDTVVGLEVGADDYITKPFELREVLARVRSVLRRRHVAPVPESAPAAGSADPESTGPAAAPERLQFLGLTLIPEKRRVIDADQREIALTAAEYDLLEIFVRSAPTVLSRDDIMDALRGQEWTPSDRTIDNQVARLRKKIDPNGAHKPIRSVRGIGYQFVEDVEFT